MSGRPEHQAPPEIVSFWVVFVFLNSSLHCMIFLVLR